MTTRSISDRQAAAIAEEIYRGLAATGLVATTSETYQAARQRGLAETLRDEPDKPLHEMDVDELRADVIRRLDAIWPADS